MSICIHKCYLNTSPPSRAIVAMFISAVMTTFNPVVVQMNSIKDNSFNYP